MKKNMSYKFTDELSVTFQSFVSGAGEFGLSQIQGNYQVSKEDGIGQKLYVFEAFFPKEYVKL